VRAAAAEAPTPLAALSAMFRAHVDFVVAHPGVPRLIFHELQQPADSATKQEVCALLRAHHKLLLDKLEQAVSQGLVMQAMRAGRPAAMHSQAERVFALFRRSLGEVS
jgi:TetR/AcrR family transcriptional regulator